MLVTEGRWRETQSVCEREREKQREGDRRRERQGGGGGGESERDELVVSSTMAEERSSTVP